MRERTVFEVGFPGLRAPSLSVGATFVRSSFGKVGLALPGISVGDVGRSTNMCDGGSRQERIDDVLAPEVRVGDIHHRYALLTGIMGINTWTGAPD